MKTRALGILGLMVGILIGFRTVQVKQPPEFDVPEGFIVEELAGDDDVGSVVALTFDNQGRMIIAKEFGDIVALIPRSDGSYEQRLVTDQVSNSQGLVYDGPDLLATAIGPEGVGLYRVIDENGDARGDRVDLVESVNRRIEDHGPHAPIWGPDGYLYWIHANTAGIYDDPAPLSPVRSYHDASLIPRVSSFYRTPEGKVYRKAMAQHTGQASGAGAAAGAGAQADWELFSMGHRNPYDFAFNLVGELFTYDSDHEPDLEMPWFRPTRTNHILPGGQYGYREGSAVHPDYYFDDAPLLEDMGRGSPTGVIAYQAYQYPEAYRDALLFADWSRGRIIRTRLTKQGAGYTPESSTFVFGTPLNVTDVAVGPDGHVYFTLGGRDTAGGLYRIIYEGPDAMAKPQAETPVEEALILIQPRSAYSRQRAADIKAAIGEVVWQQSLAAVARDAQAAPEHRVRSLELLQVHGPGLEEDLLGPLVSDPAWEVRAAAAYYLGLKTSNSARQTLAAMLQDNDPFVQRRAAEALLRTGLHPAVNAPLSAVDDVLPLLASPDPSLRFAGRALLRQINANRWREAALKLDRHPQAVEALLAYVQTVGSHQDMYNYGRIVNRELELLQANPTDAELLDLVRLMQYTMTKDQGVRNFPVVASSSRVTGGVIYVPGEGFFNTDQMNPDGTGGSTRDDRRALAYAEIGTLLLERFPSSDWRLDREIARVLAYLQTPGTMDELLAELEAPDTDVKQQIHYIDMLSRFEEGWDEAAIEQVTTWFEQAARNRAPSGSYITAMRTDFLSHLPDQQAALASARIEEAQPQAATFGGGGALSQEDIEYLIFNPQSTQGNPAAGVWAYEKAACGACHTFGPIGRQYGPDLTSVGQRFSREDLVRAIVYPSELIADQYEAVTITQTNGSAVSGSIIQDTPQGVIVQIPGGGEVSIPADQIQSRVRAEQSMMPEGLLNVLSRQEQRDLILLLQHGPSAIPDSALTRINNR